MITVDVRDPQTGRVESVTVPGRTPEEAFRYLYAIGGGLAGEGTRDLYQGTVLEPVRAGYKARLQQIETEIIRRGTAVRVGLRYDSWGVGRLPGTPDGVFTQGRL